MYSRAYVEITNVCNMACSFCHGHSREKRFMDRQAFAHILQQLTGKTQYIYYHLMGEPLLHPQLPEFLKMAAQAGFRSMITTNGTLLPKAGENILDAGVHKVSISVHSFEGEDPRAYLQGIVRFAQMAVERGTIVCLRLWNRGFDEGRNTLIKEYLQQAFSDPWTENSRGYRIRDKLFLEWGDRFQWPDLKAPVQGQQVFCYGLREQFGILCDGTVVPCCLDSEGVIALGNVFRQPLDEILQSQRAKDMVQGFSCRKATEELCRRCGYAQKFIK